MKFVGYWFKFENDLINLSVIFEIGIKFKCVGVICEIRIIYLIV